jgi:hypothetical protein
MNIHLHKEPIRMTESLYGAEGAMVQRREFALVGALPTTATTGSIDYLERMV